MTKRTPPPRIGENERRTRLAALCTLMNKQGFTATLIGPTSSLRYFTGVAWHPSERFTGVLVPVSYTHLTLPTSDLV